MDDKYIFWIGGIVLSLIGFISSIAMMWINNVSKMFFEHEKSNKADMKEIHIKFEKYAKQDDLNELRKQMIHNQELISSKLENILMIVSNKADRK